MSEVELRGVTKRYGDHVVVDAVSLTVAKGELVALLGPSGCGKTTTLRMVAGFVEPEDGAVHLRGVDVTQLPPHRRDTGMVFQSYALFPHLTVAENIAFGLKRRGAPRAEIPTRVADMLRLLELDGLGDRLPRQLSGGQQQRVAVGRALVINPAVLLLDEPFSNLDALLRESTRGELRRLQQKLGLTAIFVTHDQAEAMAIADRIAVMNRGRIEQIGPPATIYRRPRTRFVAGFIGRTNMLEARCEGLAARTAQGLSLQLGAPATHRQMTLVLRPESIALAPGRGESGANHLAGRIESIAFFGATGQVVLVGDGDQRLMIEGAGGMVERFAVGDEAMASWRAEDLVALED